VDSIRKSQHTTIGEKIRRVDSMDETSKIVEMTDEEFEVKLENLEKKLMKLKKEAKSIVDFVDKKNYLGGGHLIEIVALLERAIFKIYNFRTEMDYWTTKEEAIEITEEMNQFNKEVFERARKAIRKMKEEEEYDKYGKN